MRWNLGILVTIVLTVAAAAPAEIYWVPVAAHTEGVAGSAWRTDVSVINTCSVGVPVEVQLTTDSGTFTKAFVVGAGVQSFVNDVFTAVGATDGVGTVRVRSDGPVVVESRTYNAAAAGTPTQTYPTIVEHDAFSQGTTVLLPLLNENSAARTNLGYLWHCHILEHEDNEMMRPYRVVP